MKHLVKKANIYMHGTSLTKLDSILQNGLEIGKQKLDDRFLSDKNTTYFTEDLRTALWHASKWSDSEFNAVIYFNLDENNISHKDEILDWDKIDWDSYYQSKNHEIDPMFDFQHIVSYKGSVSPDKIIKIEFYPDFDDKPLYSCTPQEYLSNKDQIIESVKELDEKLYQEFQKHEDYQNEGD